MTSNFIINDIELAVPPTDIRATNRRNVGTSEFIRDDMSYAFKSRHNYTAYNVILQFDLLDSQSFDNLIKLSTELDLYPFVFIKSERMDALIPHTFKANNGYHIWGVQQYELIQGFESPNIITVVLELLFFNYLPLARSFSFIHLQSTDKTDKAFSINGETVQVSNVYNKSVPVAEDKEENIISLFAKYFEDEIALRRSKAEARMTMNGSLSNFIVKYPIITTEEPPDFDQLQSLGLADKVDINAGENIDEGGKPVPAVLTIFISWQTMRNLKTDSLEPLSFNSGPRAIQTLSISRRNNFASQYLAGWHTPVLQYMGKGSTELGLSVDYALNLNPTSLDVDEFGNPIDFIKFAISNIESNFIKFRAYDAYNVLRFDSFLTELCPSYSYVVNAIGDYEKDDQQGILSSSYGFFGTDTRNMRERKAYHDAGTKEPIFSTEKMISVVEQIMNSISDNDMRYQDNIADDNLKDVTGQLIETQLRFYLILTNNPNGSDSSKPVIISSENTKTDLINNFNTIRNNNITDDQKALVDKELERLTSTFIGFANANNPYAQPAKTLLNEITEDYDSLVSSFKEEAYSDLHLDKRLKISQGNLSNYKIVDPRDLNGFFFLNKDLYLNFEKFNKIYDTFAQVDNIDKLQEASVKGNELNLNEEAKKEIENVIYKNIEQKEMLPVEINVNTIENKEHIADASELYNEENVFELFKNSQINPFSIKDQKTFHNLRITKPFEEGLNLAFPSLKVYLVVSQDISPLSNFTDYENNYFELYGISNLELVTNDDESPVDYLEFTIVNPGSAYTDASTVYNENKIKSRPEYRDTSQELDITIDRKRLLTGTRLHVKAGYGNDINKLETVFNGVITEVAPYDQNETILRVCAEGFGRELVAVRHGDDLDNIFWWSAGTTNIITETLYNGEIQHFGEYKVNLKGHKNFNEDEARSLFLLDGFNWLKTNLLTNMYHEQIFDSYGEDDFRFSAKKSWFGLKSLVGGRQAGYDFAIYQVTPWEVLKEMEYRHPGMLSKPVLYGDRMSYFFGIKEQLYVYRDIDKLFSSNQATQHREEKGFFESMGDALEAIIDPYTALEEQEKKKNRDDRLNNITNSMYQKLKFMRFKPVCDFHLLTSNHNIIFNGLKLSNKFNTAVSVRYFDEFEDLAAEKFSYYKMRADDNLKPSDIREGEFGTSGIDGGFMAIRYGMTYLRREMEKMYDGTISILGNAQVKAGDYAAIFDDLRGMTGIIKVRECHHIFDKDNGFVTVITPGCMVEESMIDYSKLFETLYFACSIFSTMSRVDVEMLNESNSSYQALQFIRRQGITSEEKAELSKYLELGLQGTAHLYAGYQGLSLFMLTQNPTMQKGLGVLARGTEMLSAGAGKAGSAFGQVAQKLKGISAAAAARHAATGSRVASTAYAAARTGLFATRTGFAGVGMASVAFSRGSMYALNVLRMGVMFNPVSLLIQLALMGTVDTIFTNFLARRQPLRILPLIVHGTPYIGGITGYKENTLIESVLSNVEETGNAIKEMWDLIR